MIISISGLILLDLQFQSLFTARDLRGPLPLITNHGRSLFTDRDLRGHLPLITNRGHSLFTDRDLRGPLPLITKRGHSLFTVACANAVYVMFCIFTYTKILVLRRKYVSSMEKCRCYIHALIVDSISLHCSDALNMRALSNELMVLEVLNPMSPEAFRENSSLFWPNQCNPPVPLQVMRTRPPRMPISTPAPPGPAAGDARPPAAHA